MDNIDKQYDIQTFIVMKKALKKSSNCIDVGAHAGTILSKMLYYAPNGVHYAFEPLPQCYALLKANFPTVNVNKIALSDKNDITKFQHVVNEPAYSGIKRRRYDKQDMNIEEIIVETRRLDDIYPQTLPVNLIKIDVEGAEYLVLRGAIEIIKRHKPIIIFEHGLGAADYYDTAPGDMYDLLTVDCGLRVSTMEKWLKGDGYFTREEFEEQFNKGINYYFIAYGREVNNSYLEKLKSYLGSFSGKRV
jgi:FkbM family methyltransferase